MGDGGNCGKCQIHVNSFALVKQWVWHIQDKDKKQVYLWVQ